MAPFIEDDYIRSFGNYIRDTAFTAGNFVCDIALLGRSRRLASEINHLTELLGKGVKSRFDSTEISQEETPQRLLSVLVTDLEHARRHLARMAGEEKSPSPPPIKVHFGPPSPPKGTDTSPRSYPSNSEKWDIGNDIASSPVPSEAPAPSLVADEQAPDYDKPSMIDALIELRDRLTRLDNDIVPPERLLTVGARKTLDLLAELGVEPIEENGPFNVRTQRIVDCVVTDDPALHMTVAETVLPGYRLGGRIVRPQTIFAYRCADAENGSQ